MERDHRSISAVDGVMFRQVGTRAGADRVDRPDAQRRPRVLRAGVAGKPGALRVRAGPEPGGCRGHTYWRESSSGPPRRYYRITRVGLHAPEAFKSKWRRFSSAIDQLLEDGK